MVNGLNGLNRPNEQNLLNNLKNMNSLIGIRREDKNIFERHVLLVPEDVRKLKREHYIEIILQELEEQGITFKEKTEVIMS